MLKCDFHLHTSEDPIHSNLITYSAYDLIDRAVQQKYDVIAITNHKHATVTKDMISYAKKKGLLLISGCEMRIEGKDVLVYNVTPEDIAHVKTFRDLRRLPFVMAPHPFHMIGACLGNKLRQHVDCFDAVEYSHFYTRYINPNLHTLRFAVEHGLPVVGTSDCHFAFQFGTTYSQLDTKKKTIKGVFDAIRNHKVRVHTRPLSTWEASHIFGKMQVDYQWWRLKKFLTRL